MPNPAAFRAFLEFLESALPRAATPSEVTLGPGGRAGELENVGAAS